MPFVGLQVRKADSFQDSRLAIKLTPVGEFGYRSSGEFIRIYSFMKSIASAIRSLIGNKSAEKDIRSLLTQQGYNGKSAEFAEIELHAIQRPGWLQVFRFEAHWSNDNGDLKQLFGALRSDERYADAQFFVDERMDVRDEQLAIWALGLITQKRHRK